MSDITDPARSIINGGDEVTIQLIRPRMPDIERTLHPTTVRIVWPSQPTSVDPDQFRDTAAAMVRLFS
jgi:hypothetical protein